MTLGVTEEGRWTCRLGHCKMPSTSHGAADSCRAALCARVPRGRRAGPAGLFWSATDTPCRFVWCWRRRHEAAAAAHVRSDIYTPAPHRTYAASLDDLCHDESMGESRPPLVLVGEVGSGKSSVLANWVHQRRTRAKGLGATSEFVFHHIAGCSRDSTSVANLLFRIVTEMKNFFGLQIEVSENEQKLSWEFIRALDSASRKGRIILVVDGLKRLRSHGFSGLKWLPLHFPPNVRVVLSTSASAADVSQLETESTVPQQSFFLTQPKTSAELPRAPKAKDRTLAEIVRRRWPLLQLGYLSAESRADIVNGFFERFGAGDDASVDTAAGFAAMAPAGVDGGAADGRPDEPGAPSGVTVEAAPAGPSGSLKAEAAAQEADAKAGSAEGGSGSERPIQLQLLPSQRERIIQSPACAAPQFLRVLLETTRHAAREGMDVCAVLEDCLGCSSLIELYEMILRRWTRGAHPAPPPAEPVKLESATPRKSPTREQGAAEGKATVDASRLLDEGRVESKATDSEDYGTDGFEDDDPASGAEASKVPEGDGEAEEKRAKEADADDELPESAVDAAAADGGGGGVEAGDSSGSAAVLLYGVPMKLVESRDVPRSKGSRRRASAGSAGGAGGSDGKADGGAQRAHGRGPAADGSADSVPFGGPTGADSPSRGVSRAGARPKRTVLGHGPAADEREANAERARNEARASLGDAAPAYLTGGARVEPLGPILGASLCFLYGSRHGLLLPELAALLKHEVRPLDGAGELVLGGNFERLQNLLLVLGATVVDGMTSLAPLNQTMRALVYRTYLVKGEGLSRVQQSLISFHSRAPVSARRAEELPWLLERRKMWGALKDELLDLQMFAILWTPTHKFDLFRYWGILSGAARDDNGASLGVGEGAAKGDVDEVATALVDDADAAGSSADGAGSGAAPPSGRRSVASSRNGGRRGSRSVAGRTRRRRARKGPASRVDIVDEYNKAVESWYASCKPSVSELGEVLRGIEDFLFAYGEQEGDTPEFSHRPVSDAALESLMVQLKHAPSKSAGASQGVKLSLENMTRGHYYYKRWVWLEFPWMSLAKTEEMMKMDDSAFFTPGTGLDTRSAFGAPPGTAGTSRGHTAGSLGGTQRSLWSVKKQTPNVAMPITLSPTKVNSQMRAALVGSAGVPSLASMKRQEDAMLVDPKQARGSQSILGSAGYGRDSASASGKRRRRKKRGGSSADGVMRFDPTTSSLEAGGGAGGAAAGGGTSTRSGDDDDAPGRAGQRRLPPNVIPFSNPSTKSVRTGTTTPSVELLSRDDPFRTNSIFSGGVIGLDETGNADTPIPVVREHLTARPAHLQAYPATSFELEQAQAAHKLSNLRRQHDRLKSIVLARQKELAELEQTVADRSEQDAHTDQVIRDAEAMMEALEQRVDAVNDSIQQADRLGTFYERIILVAERHPAKDKHHVERVEKALETAKLEVEDRKAEAQGVVFEARHLMTKEKPELEKEIARATAMRKKVLAKLRRQRIRAAEARDFAARASRKRTQIINQVAGDLSTAQEARLRALTAKQQEYESKLKLAHVQQRKRIAEFQNAFRRIRAATGISDASELYAKFTTRDTAVDALMEQRDAYEKRAAALRQEQEKALAELEALKFGDDQVTSRYIRKVDEKNNAAEAILNQNREKYLFARHILKDVKAGVNHLAGLLNIDLAELRRTPDPSASDDERESPVPDGTVPHLLRVVEARCMKMLSAIAEKKEEEQPSTRVGGAAAVAALAADQVAAGSPLAARRNMALMRTASRRSTPRVTPRGSFRAQDDGAEADGDDVSQGGSPGDAPPRSIHLARPGSADTGTGAESIVPFNPEKGSFGLEGMGLPVNESGFVELKELLKPSRSDNVFVPSKKHLRSRELDEALAPESDDDEEGSLGLLPSEQEAKRRADEEVANGGVKQPIATYMEDGGTMYGDLTVPPRMAGLTASEAANYLGMGMGVVAIQGAAAQSAEAPRHSGKGRRRRITADTIDAVTNSSRRVATRTQLKEMAFAVEGRLKKKRTSKGKGKPTTPE